MRSMKVLIPITILGVFLLALIFQFPTLPSSAADSPLMLPTGQTIHPAGQTTAFDERPLDIAISTDGQTLFVKCVHQLLIFDAETMQSTQSLDYPKGEEGSMHGLAVAGDAIYVTGSQKLLLEAKKNANGQWQWSQEIALGTEVSTPCGVAVSASDQLAYVCVTMRNTLAVVDLATAKVLREIPTGVCPMAVSLDEEGRNAYVCNFGGRRGAAGEHTEDSAGTQVLVDDRSISRSGTVDKIDLKNAQVICTVDVGLHPSDLQFSRDGKYLFVANANSDSVSILNAETLNVEETIPVRPDPDLPFGSIPNALCVSEDGRWLFTANGGNNALAMLKLSPGNIHKSTLKGFIPTGWFPGAICTDKHYLYIANVKGDLSRLNTPDAKKFTSKRNRGSITKLHIPRSDELSGSSEQVARDAGVGRMLDTIGEKARSGVNAVPIPERVGEPSTIEHVVYVIKENRTYDQLFGDLPQGNNDPSLCTYGREVTPNQHSLAEEFSILDNYYCNGIVSADGHQWATQGAVTDYQEKMFGGHPRGFDLGTDALTYAQCNFLWDSAIQRGLSFRNYGEFDFPNVEPANSTWFDVYNDFQNDKHQIKFNQLVHMDTLRKYTCREYPGWNLAIPDVLRVKVFLNELKQYEQRGEWPSLIIVYLPQDHTSGVGPEHPTPRAFVADNDLALGQLVDGISHSKFWSKTAIFVNEDDPQDGWDHVDGHRSTCLVISPYAKRHVLISKFYNQLSVLRTIERILALPSVCQWTAQAPVMDECFTAEPDLTPYTARPNLIPLDERNIKVGAREISDRKLVAATKRLDLSRPDRIDDDSFNRILWHASKGMKVRYPSGLSGAHGKGLPPLNLESSGEHDDHDDD